jgi:coenzyme F420-reducing hydrogenase delta subunit
MVNPALCVSCGICVGACPSSTPFRRTQDLKTGIDLPEYTLAELRERTIVAARGLVGPARVLVLACQHGGGATHPGVVSLPCVAMAPPSLIDYILSKNLADGVVVAGCAERACFNRLGIVWTEQRFAQQRDPYLRTRVPRERVGTVWTSDLEISRFEAELGRFVARIAALPPARPVSPPAPRDPPEIAAQPEPHAVETRSGPP